MGKRRVRKTPRLVRGDLCEVVWLDIAGGDGDAPENPVFITPGYYYGWKRIDGRRCLITRRSKIIEGTPGYQLGWDSYPAPNVIEVKKT